MEGLPPALFYIVLANQVVILMVDIEIQNRDVGQERDRYLAGVPPATKNPPDLTVFDCDLVSVLGLTRSLLVRVGDRSHIGL